MNNPDLCLALMLADSEQEVVDILTDQGYWADERSWRYLGDAENNFSTIGNQQSEPIAALVEKVINGVDARLVNACWINGVDPESSEAPGSIRNGVARFFEERVTFNAERDGQISNWSDTMATEHGRLITVSATGSKPAQGRLSISIADQGEGQTPDSFPDTFMSLMRSNKLRIHFVQGKFNMGGTGALNFCSERHRLQLIVSRRNPALLGSTASKRDSEWGFTVVRRQAGAAGARSSVYTYLAPYHTDDESLGEVLSFHAEGWPIFPDDPAVPGHGADNYVRLAPHGSLIKLYEYSWQGGTSSNIVSSGGGLLRRLDVALPELALPVRLFECRDYQGGVGSFSTNALGLVARLSRDRAGKLEPESPIFAEISIEGNRIPVRIFAFTSKAEADNYRTRPYGVVFAVNGQMHASFSTDFFSRKAVNLAYLAGSLLVVLDCSNIEEGGREDLFMNSRDRLRTSQRSTNLERELEHLLKNDPTLRILQNRRREQQTAERLKEDRPLAEVLQSILRQNPLLSKLFAHGLRLASPFPLQGAGAGGQSAEFRGLQFPTFFRFKGKHDGEMLTRDARLGSRIRVAFETDAEDDYFDRDESPGAWRVQVMVDGELVDALDWTRVGPRSGIIQLWLSELPESAQVGSVVEYVVDVTDDSRIDTIQNRMVLNVVPPASNEGVGGGGNRGGNTGRGTVGTQSQLALPPITPVRQAEWRDYGFDETTALDVILADSSGSGASEMWDFYINMDNKYLKIAQKEQRVDPKVLEGQFMYGMVLVGLAMIEEGRNGIRSANGDVPSDRSTDRTRDLVRHMTRGLAPVLLPMIAALGGLAVEEAA